MERSTIHLLHKRGKSQREIASELGRSRSAVARALSEPVDRQSSGRRRKSSVDAFREQIAEWLKQGLSGVRLMELAREDPDHPYVGGSSVWRAAVRRERLSGLHEQAVADTRSPLVVAARHVYSVAAGPHAGGLFARSVAAVAGRSAPARHRILAQDRSVTSAGSG
jgi:transposase